MLTIRKASAEEFAAVRDFYWSLIDMLETAEYKPGWQKNVYPSDDYLMTSLEKGELVVGTLDDSIASAMIINQSCNESYAKANWPNEIAENQFTVIHALGVLPTFGKRGLAGEMVRFALENAKAQGQKAVRLDVLFDNSYAEKLYLKHGFRYADTVSMFYEDTGWTDFKLYEYLL